MQAVARIFCEDVPRAAAAGYPFRQPAITIATANRNRWLLESWHRLRAFAPNSRKSLSAGAALSRDTGIFVVPAVRV